LRRDREIDREALRRIEPDVAGRVDLAAARGLEAQALYLQGVALQREQPLAASQLETGVGQRHRRVGERHRARAGDRVADGETEVRTQSAGLKPR